MNNLGHKIFKGYQDIVSYISPTLKQSKFYTEGKLTPEEFVLAGDFLVLKCPTWKWCSAKDNLYNSALPKDKQYLLTTVKSNSRASDYIKDNGTIEVQIEDDWVEENLNINNENKKEEEPEKIMDLDLENDDNTNEQPKKEEEKKEEIKKDIDERDGKKQERRRKKRKTEIKRRK